MSTRAGRPPKPSHLKIISGNPGRRPINDREPKPKLTIPPCPRHLDGEARKHWQKMAKKLHGLGLLTEIDGDALALYCLSWSRWREAETELKKSGLVVKTVNGYPILNPYLSVIKQEIKTMQNLLNDFGCTPASRSRIHAQPVEKDDGEAKKEKRFFG